MFDIPKMSLACLGYVNLLSTDFVLEFLRCPMIFCNWDALSVLILNIIVLVVTLFRPVKTSEAPADHMAHFLDDVVIALLYLTIIEVIGCYDGSALQLDSIGSEALGAHDLMCELR